MGQWEGRRGKECDDQTYDQMYQYNNLHVEERDEDIVGEKYNTGSHVVA